MSKRKYKPGPVIRDPLTVISLIMAGHPLYNGDKVQTRGWMASHQLNMIWHSARRGHYRLALPADEGKKA